LGFLKMMKKIILTLILGIVITSCAKLNDPSEKLPRDLDLALQSANEIQGDDDVKDKEIRNVAICLAEVGWNKTAAQLLSDLKSYHGVVALCDLSITFAHKNQQSIAQGFYQKAKEIAHLLVLNIPRPILISLAHVAAANRDFKNADEWAARIGEKADQAEVQSKIFAEKMKHFIIK
jgi:phosphoribosyl 1,2-cyclic phosphodiesterase